MQKKILIIEDEVDLADALQVKLENQGYDVTVCNDGENGLQKVFEIRPDVILLDVMLPSINGLMVLDRVRSDEWGKDARVIMLTNRDDEGTVSEADRHKANGYLVKSNYSLEDLVVKIKELVRG